MSSDQHAFSPSLTLAGMDYIAPSVECIKPTMMRTAAAAAATANARASPHGDSVVGRHKHVRDETDTAGGHDVAAAALPSTGEVLKITLQDCLACSGCVTTAETILVNAQSRSELIRARAAAPQRPWLVTISEQSAAALAAQWRCSVADAYATVAGFVRTVLRGGGGAEDDDSEHTTTAPVMYVADLRWASRLSSQLTAHEYARRRRDAPERLPLLVSACPGWVCYCEKQGAALLPYLCNVLSPQGLAGSLAKRGVCAALYHMSIQPCFDRKLEAARDGYVAATPDDGNVHVTSTATTTMTHDDADVAGARVPYTDCVISTAELLAWMCEVDATLPWRGTLDSLIDDADDDVAAMTTTATTTTAAAEEMALWEGSGGYHRHVIAHMLRTQAQTAATGDSDKDAKGQQQQQCVGSVDMRDVRYTLQRNRNHQLVTCARLPEQTFCIAYGFQQIQNVVRGLKKRLPAMRRYSFVEMMACPGGCLNGGGQVRHVVSSPSATTASADDAGATTAAVCTSTLEATQQRFADYLARSTAHTYSSHNNNNNSNDNTIRHSDTRDTTAVAGASAASDALPLFCLARMSALATALGPTAWTCTFTDRQKAFERMLDEGNGAPHDMPRAYYKPVTTMEQVLGLEWTKRVVMFLCGVGCSVLGGIVYVNWLKTTSSSSTPPSMLPREHATSYGYTTAMSKDTGGRDAMPPAAQAATRTTMAASVPRSIAAFANDVRRLRLLATRAAPGGFTGEEYEDDDDVAVDADEDYARVCKLYTLEGDGDGDGDGAAAMTGYGDTQHHRYDSTEGGNNNAVVDEDEDEEDDAEAVARDAEAQAVDLAAYRVRVQQKLRHRAIAAQLNEPGLLYVGRTPATLQPYGFAFRALVVDDACAQDEKDDTAAAAAAAGAASNEDDGGDVYVRVQWKPSKHSGHVASPLHWAVLGRAHDAIRYLVDNGAQVDSELHNCAAATTTTAAATRTHVAASDDDNNDKSMSRGAVADVHAVGTTTATRTSPLLPPGLTPLRVAVDNESHTTLRVLRSAAAARAQTVHADTAALQLLESRLEQRKARRERRQLARDQRRAVREEAEQAAEAAGAMTTASDDNDDDNDDYDNEDEEAGLA